ncbi:exostosin-like 3 [Plakobranchus ocellatus]|uniref:Exostosin-like 3 n=1 Tax=Plakobranchus ocellatus TaxID=259542 RepID=A0AAV4DPA4_9GAST|nr:exostosin-like 3 [Plakobranchus ocellatus]
MPLQSVQSLSVVTIIGIMTKLSKKIHRLHTVPAFKLVLGLLVVVVLLSILGHSYISNMVAGDSSARQPWTKYGVIGDGHNRILGPNNYPFRGRQIEGYDNDGLDSDPVGGRPLALSYQKEIEELRHVRTSVTNELRDLENKRLRLQNTIKNYQTNLDDMKMKHVAIVKEIGQVRLSLDQIKFERDESLAYIPNIRAPVKILHDTNSFLHDDKDAQYPYETFSSEKCSMETCFDFSRCSLVSGFPVYFYDPSVHILSMPGHMHFTTTGERLLSIVQQFFDKSVYRTREPEKACMFVVLLSGDDAPPASSSTAGSSWFPPPHIVEKFLYDLPHWGGDGRNHVILHLAQTDSSDPMTGVNTGRAMMAKTSYSDTAFREGFDIILPPNTGPSSAENLWQGLPLLSPLRRHLLLSYWGQYVDSPQRSSPVNLKEMAKNNARKKQVVEANKQYMHEMHIRNRKPLAVEKLQSHPSLHHEHSSSHHKSSPFYFLEQAIITSLESIPNTLQGDVLIDVSCDGEKVLHAGISNSSSVLPEETLSTFLASDWALCGSEQARKDVLLHSTFTLVLSPLNSSLDSTLAFQTRVLEALRHGSIPLVLGNSHKATKLLPFAESLQWKTSVLVLPVPRVTEIPFYLQSFPDEDIASLRLQGREFYGKFLGSTHSILETLLAVLRQRLDIPPHPIPEEPSPSAFPADFTPLIYEGPDVEPETDEVLGPIEAPFASETFRTNFSAALSSDMFNKFGDPFHLYPFTPFQSVLPSESKFTGSNYGFRPVNRGAGGDGISFSQALGGNYRREQFTIVMLTYQREVVLMQALQRFKSLPFLNKVVVVWNSEAPPSPELRWPQIGVPIKVVKTKKNSLNNRFLPYAEIETEAILSIDDDAHLRHDEIVFGFSYVMPQAIRDKVDEYLNCEDIAMNFLVSHITRKPPVKVTSRWTFRCPGCPTALFNDPTHFEERHKCINFFHEVYGYTPLLYTQYRVDSVLFKTRISHDKTKCFKYV